MWYLTEIQGITAFLTNYLDNKEPELPVKFQTFQIQLTSDIIKGLLCHL